MTTKHAPGPWQTGDSDIIRLMVYCADTLGSRVAASSDTR